MKLKTSVERHALHIQSRLSEHSKSEGALANRADVADARSLMDWEKLSQFCRLDLYLRPIAIQECPSGRQTSRPSRALW